MIRALVLLAVLQAAPDPLLEKEKERLRSKAPLAEAAKKSYAFPGADPLKPRASYTLAVLPVSFSDRAFGATDVSKFFFEQVAGYYAKASGGRFALKGKAFAPVTLAATRAAFADRDLEAAVAAWTARDGVKVLEGVDGVAFVAAGPLGSRGTPLWPHRDTLPAGDRKIDYLLVAEDAGDRAVGIAAHEFMHLLGFRDKYDDEKAAVGGWCILGTGYASKDPAPPCADCREKLGWTTPSVLDPSRESRIVLDRDTTRSLKITVNPDGTEYLLLELRDRLFVWHVGGGMTIELVGQWPLETSDRLTPLSEPAFRGRSVGARDVWITDIRLEGGRAWFAVGPEAPLTPIEERRRSRVGKRLGD
jgi:M6 family metalloprotease-like protein